MLVCTKGQVWDAALTCRDEIRFMGACGDPLGGGAGDSDVDDSDSDGASCGDSESEEFRGGVSKSESPELSVDLVRR